VAVGFRKAFKRILGRGVCVTKQGGAVSLRGQGTPRPWAKGASTMDLKIPLKNTTKYVKCEDIKNF
jgi:hypothetical protein